MKAAVVLNLRKTPTGTSSQAKESATSLVLTDATLAEKYSFAASRPGSYLVRENIWANSAPAKLRRCGADDTTGAKKKPGGLGRPVGVLGLRI